MNPVQSLIRHVIIVICSHQCGDTDANESAEPDAQQEDYEVVNHWLSPPYRQKQITNAAESNKHSDSNVVCLDIESAHKRTKYKHYEVCFAHLVTFRK